MSGGTDTGPPPGNRCSLRLHLDVIPLRLRRLQNYGVTREICAVTKNQSTRRNRLP